MEQRLAGDVAGTGARDRSSGRPFGFATKPSTSYMADWRC
jgi:hypothetical protein